MTKNFNRDNLFPQLSGLFRKKSLPKVSAWMTKINSWIKKAALLGLLTGAATIAVEPVMGQVHQITNGRSVQGHNQNGTAASGIDGTPGSWQPNAYWFGLDAGNNAIVHLNSSSGNNATINISNLDNYQNNNTRGYYTYSWNSGTNSYDSTWHPVNMPEGPVGNAAAYSSAYGGTVTVNSGQTVELTASYVVGTSIGVNTASVPNDQLFSFNTTSGGDFIKTGGGTLNIKTNTYINGFTGNDGILGIDGRTDGTLAGKFARIDNTTANLTGGDGTTGTATNYNDQRSDFTFISGSIVDPNLPWESTANVGTAGNIWDIGTLNGDGFTAQGVMNVGTASHLNRTTTVEGTNGRLWINSTTAVGTDAGQSIFNVVSGGKVRAETDFTAASAAAARVYFNVDGVGSTVEVQGNSNFATADGSEVTGIISQSGKWTNQGVYVVGDYGKADITVTGNNSELWSGDRITVGKNTGAVGILTADQSASIHSEAEIHVGSQVDATGILKADHSAVITAAWEIEVAINGTATTSSRGIVEVDHLGRIDAQDGYLIIAGNGYGTMTIRNGGGVNVRDLGGPVTPGNTYIGKGPYGYGEVYVDGDSGGQASRLQMDGDLITGEAGTGLLFITNGALTHVGGDHVIAQGETYPLRSFGRDVVSGNGSRLEILGNLTVGEDGDAGGRYDYIGVGYNGGWHQDPTQSGTGKWLYPSPALPPPPTPSAGNPYPTASFNGSPNLTAAKKNPDGTPNNPYWDTTDPDYIGNNSPGLAIVAGAHVTVGEFERDSSFPTYPDYPADLILNAGNPILHGGDAVVGGNKEGYGYILLDNSDNDGVGNSTLDVLNDFIVADKGEAYLRIVKGSIVNVGINTINPDTNAVLATPIISGPHIGNMIIGNQGDVNGDGNKGHGTVRVNGGDGSSYARLNINNDLTTGNHVNAQGFLYVHEGGIVKVGNDHIIGNDLGSFGRDHIDGVNSTLSVKGDLTVARNGKAGGTYEYRIDSANPHGDPAEWFDSHNLLLEPDTILGVSVSAATLNGVTKSWADVEKNAPGFALTKGAQADAQNVFAGNNSGSWSYILIDDKNNATTTRANLTARENMTIADQGTAYTRVLNGGRLVVGTDNSDSLFIGKTSGKGTLRIGDTDGNNPSTPGRPNHVPSTVAVTGQLITGGNGTADTGTDTNGNATGYLYAANGSSTTVNGSHIVADGVNNFGRDHFDGTGTTLTINDTVAGSRTIIGNKGDAGGQYRYTLGGGYANDPTAKGNVRFSNDGTQANVGNGNGHWYDSANLLYEPEFQTSGNAANYTSLSPADWALIAKNSPGLALTAGAKGTIKEPVIVGNTATGYGYVLLDSIDGASAADRSELTIANGTADPANNKGNLTLGKNGDAYVRVINGSRLSVANDLIVAENANGTANTNPAEATIRINGSHANDDATLNVGGKLTVAKETNAEGNLYAYENAKVNVTGDVTIAEAEKSYGRAQFDGVKTEGNIGGKLTVGESGQAGLAYKYIAHLDATQDADGVYRFNNELNDPNVWFDSVNTLDDDIDLSKQGYTLNAANPARVNVGNLNVNGLKSQNNAPGFLVSDGAKVKSNGGIVAKEAGSVGYVVIDNKPDNVHNAAHTNAPKDTSWTLTDDLTIAEYGTAYTRVLNGGLLEVTTDSFSNTNNLIIAEKEKSRGTLRVQDEGSHLQVSGDLITAKNGIATGGQENIAVGNFYLHDKATAEVEGKHTIAEGIYSEGRDHIDGTGTVFDIGSTLTVGENGYAGNYVYHKGNSDNAKDPTNYGQEFNQWFDSQNTLLEYSNATGELAENMPGLAITAGAKVSSGNGMIAQYANANAHITPANATDTAFRSNGYFVVDNAGKVKTPAGARSEWNVKTDSLGNGSPGNLVVASEGTGYGRVINGAILTVENDMTIAELSDTPLGTGDAHSRGTVRVYGKDQDYVSQLKVTGNLTTAKEGTGSLYIYKEAQATVDGDHTIAEVRDSYGNDHIDGHNTTLEVTGDITVGKSGQAGGHYDYIALGKGGNPKDPDQWFDSDNTLATPANPDGSPNTTTWTNGANGPLPADINAQNAIQQNAPGLAITAGAKVTSGGGKVGVLRDTATGEQGYGYVVIDSKDKDPAYPADRSVWAVKKTLGTGNLTVAQNGEAYVRVINGSLLDVEGNMAVGSDNYGYGTVRVNGVDSYNGVRSELHVYGNLTTGGSGTNDIDFATGNLYAHDQAKIQVDGNHVIADGRYSVGRDHIDGVKTTMDVLGKLTVGNEGSAGGWYQEDRYIRPGTGNSPIPNTHYYASDPTANGERWLDNVDRTLEELDRSLNNLGNVANAKDGEPTGNSPGLAITAGAVVQSGAGLVAAQSGAGWKSNGYVVIDDKRVAGDNQDVSDTYRTRWIVKRDSPFGAGLGSDAGLLSIGGKGNGVVRVLNGSLLQSETTTIAHDDGARGYLFVTSGNIVPESERKDALTNKATTWRPSEWISLGSTVIGATAGDERGTIRIEEGAHGATMGLHLGLEVGSQGEVSVSGFSGSGIDPTKNNFDQETSTRSLLEIYKDLTRLSDAAPAGSSTLSVSDYGYLWMHEQSELKLNGVGIISNGAILHLSEARVKNIGEYDTDPWGIFTNDLVLSLDDEHKRLDMIEKMRQEGGRAYKEGLDRTALLDAMTSKITIINARVEGDGIVTGEDGVFIVSDSASGHNPTGSDTVIDPGQRYDWHSRNEYQAYYGTLVFGDQLRLTGDVITNFDVNSGYYIDENGNQMGGNAGNNPAPQVENQDLIVVKRGNSSTSKSDVLAQLSGTLNVHARLTDYYAEKRDLLVVQTIGDGNSGSILSKFDNLHLMPDRFFENPTQEIRQDLDQNDQLWITMKRKNNPFEETGNTYNEKQTGKGLDSVYMDQVKSGRKDWLPVLRYFWYITDEKEFLDAYRLLSGEIRAHSLLLPMTNQYRYAHNRMDFRECINPKHDHTKPNACDESADCNEYVRCGAAKHKWKDRFHRLIKDSRVWGSVIYDDMETDNDGNAGDNGMHRYGFVGGIDKPFLRKDSYIGVMVGIDRGSMISHWQKAKDDDFNIGLYHGTKLFNDQWEWKNYIGFGVQDYNMRRDVNLNFADLDWQEDDEYYKNIGTYNNGGRLKSDFLGYSLSGSTEFARPFYFGGCKQYMFRPYAALDLAAVWQNGAKEKLGFENSGLVALEYLSAENIRVFARPGFLLERNGKHASLHGGLSYAFLMGGRRYTDVDNKFQIGGDPFNIRGVDDGSGYATWNFGGTTWLGKKKDWSITLEYWGTAGSHSVMNSGQLAAQKKF